MLQELISEDQFMEWRERGKKLMKDERDRQWALGSWIVDGERMKEAAAITVNQRFKNAVYKAAAEITGHSIATIKSLAFVVRNVDEEVKDEFQVSFAHLKLVASENQERQRDLLSQVARSNLTVAEARAKMQHSAGIKPEKKSKADRQAALIILYGNKLLEALNHHEWDSSRHAELSWKILEIHQAIAEAAENL